MMWTLLKDAVGFYRRHLWALIVLVLPIQLVLVFLFEFSGVEAMLTDYVQQTSQVQAKSDVDSSMDFLRLWEGAPVSSLTSFFLFLIGSILPSAIVIAYVRRVFIGESSTPAKVYNIAWPLWVKMIGLYSVTWGAAVCAGIGFIFVFVAMGFAQAGVISFFITGFFGCCTYLHFRLSLAPYFCAQSRIGVIDALKVSWQYAQPVVMVLMLGNFIVHMVVIIALSCLGALVRSIVPEALYQGVDVCISVLSGLAAILQVVFTYRVFAHVADKNQESN